MLIIGIAGGTGSGKTTVVKKIIARCPKDEVVVMPQDAYYKDNSNLPIEERLEINFDHPNAVEFDLLVEHINKLKNGEDINMPIYSYLTCTRSAETIPVKPKKVIIVEGILIFTNAELRNLCDIKVFVDADADDRLIRVIKRDIIERGRSIDKVLERYIKTVKPSHIQFIEPTKTFADLIVPQGGDNLVAIDILTHFIELKLNKTK
ncbi:MAG: uridine kinase [Bacteroidetes bacterium CG02_land_8_20_14_3_00_31_25]|nr:uridine kinase [Bacteroidota bacterium]PIV59605.1 MAG: uridine kinase [Bacteroidetes bacterium CG02_land_8_20_14_3_00_31_25]PIX35764.1 MAG: uridine kinase [Bacteroidetes bacterium CG_4_8_14_3_um_filter_31_14]PIY02630.1 MAG: uridine kinase [Bacteroidetes bacterium CG_4_10_14_3_um_filter_31_20]